MLGSFTSFAGALALFMVVSVNAQEPCGGKVCKSTQPPGEADLDSVQLQKLDFQYAFMHLLNLTYLSL